MTDAIVTRPAITARNHDCPTMVQPGTEPELQPGSKNMAPRAGTPKTTRSSVGSFVCPRVSPSMCRLVWRQKFQLFCVRLGLLFFVFSFFFVGYSLLLLGALFNAARHPVGLLALFVRWPCASASLFRLSLSLRLVSPFFFLFFSTCLVGWLACWLAGGRTRADGDSSRAGGSVLF